MTARLGAVARNNWPQLDGYAVAHGMKDPRLMPLDRFCHFVYFILTRNEDPQSRTKIDAQLWQPPIEELIRTGGHIDPRSPWSAENETKALTGFKASLGGTPSGGVS